MSADETPSTDNGAPDGTDVERAVEESTLDYGDLFARAVYASFFYPPVIGMSGGNGAPLFPVHGKPPVQQVADHVWSRCGTEVATRIARDMDVETLIERVTDRLYERLTTETERDDRFTGRRVDNLTPAMPDVQRMVRERLAAKLTDRAMAEYDREQEQMRAAWERERERAAGEPPAIETTGTDTP